MSRLPVEKLGKHTSLISSGSTPLGGSQVYLKNGPVLFIRSQNVLMNQLDVQSAVYISDEIDRKMGRTRLQADDVLLNITGASIGRVATFDGQSKRANVNQHVCVIRPDPRVLNARYLSRLIATPAFQGRIQQTQVGGTRQALTFSQIANFEVPLPPVREQRRIAEVLDRAEALRAKRRAALAQLDTLTQAIFLDLFGDPATNPKGWPIKKIGDLLQSATYGTSKKAASSGAFAVLRMNNITRTGETDLKELKYMDLGASDQNRHLVTKGDVLFNRTNSAELVGKTAIFRELQPMAYAGYLVRLRVTAENDPEYLARFLNTAYAKRMLRGMCKSIIGMANINAKEIQAMKIAQPPKELQNEFARRVAAVEKLRITQRASLAELDALFAVLQHRAFRGEL